MNDSMTVSSTTISTTPLPAAGSTRASELSARAGEFWTWWTGELRALVPAQVISWVVGDVTVSDVMVDGAGIKLMRLEAGKYLVRMAVPFAEVSTDPVLRESRVKGNDRVRVLLSADQVLLKTITLPAAIEENLREVMGFELDRHTPFMAVQAYYDVKVLRRDAQRESIEVLLAVASRSVVDPLLAALRQAGLSIDGMTVADVGAATQLQGHAIELLPAGDKPARKWGNLLKLNLALLAMAVLLGLFALLLPIWQKREQVIALNPLVVKASADYEASQRVYEEYTKLANLYNYITGKKQGVHTSLAILEELTKISPDTTSLQSLDLKSNGKTREVTLTGEAQAASKVIESLEQSPLFQNASQRSGSRRGSLGTNEWFQIATEVKPKALPVASSAGELSPAPIEMPVAPVVVPPALAPATLPPAASTEPASKNAPPKTEPPTPAAPNPTATVVPPPAKAAGPMPTVTVLPPLKAAPAEPVPVPPATPSASGRQP